MVPLRVIEEEDKETLATKVAGEEEEISFMASKLFSITQMCQKNNKQCVSFVAKGVTQCGGATTGLIMDFILLSMVTQMQLIVEIPIKRTRVRSQQ